jgi:glycosyltransferase involved in cell wall biosynthesis
MHVALVHTDFRVSWPARILALAKSLQEKNVRLSVVEIAGRGSFYDLAARPRTEGELDWYVLFPDRDLRELPPRVMAQAVERTLDKLQPNVVMAGAIAFPSGVGAVRWARRKRRGVIVFDDARLQDVPRSCVVAFVKTRVYANVDAVMVPAPSHAASYVAWGIPATRIFFGVDVVDNEWFAPRVRTCRKDLRALRRELGLPSRYFLGVGRHVGKKNWGTCLSAYADYRRQAQQRPWGLVLVGDGPDHAGLREAIAERDVPDVHLPGAVWGEKLVGYYAAAGALILPSLVGETWGLVVNEAMACGLPVLVSSHCGCAETLVQDGVNGWRFSPERPAELAERMRQMSSLSDLRHQKMASASREIIRLWGLERFVEGAEAAIVACQDVRRGFVSWSDRLLLSLWNGRFRPT